VELGQLGYRYSFKTSTEENTPRSVAGARVNVLLPLKLSERTYLLPGLRYWQYNIEPGDNLNWYLLQIGIQTQLSERWALQVLPLVRTGIYSDGTFTDGFQLGLLSTATKKINDRLSLGFGIYTNHELFGQLLTPIMTIDWRINDRWRLFGNFPMFNTLTYSIDEKWNTGINYVGLVTSFGADETYIERQSLDFSWFLERYLTSQIVVQFRLGYPVGRRFEEYEKGDKVDLTLSLLRFGDERTLLNVFDESQFFAAFHVFFRMKK
jgi:hypothetical protein